MPYNAVAPNAGIFQNDARAGYLGLLASQKADPILAAADRFALMIEANQGGDKTLQYLAALKATNDQQARQAELETQADVTKSYLAALAANANAGVSSAVTLPENPYFTVNADQLAAADTVALDAAAQGAFKDRATGTTELLDAGVNPGATYIAQSLAGPLNEAPPEVSMGYMTPMATTARMNAQANQTQAGAAVTRANREPTASQLAKISYTPSMYGLPVAPTFRGTPEQVAAAQAAWAKTQGQAQPAPTSAPNTKGKRFVYDPTTGTVVDTRK